MDATVKAATIPGNLPVSILSQVDQTLYGIKEANSALERKNKETFEAFQKKLDSNLREQYDSLIPNIHVIESTLLINQIIAAIKMYFFRIIEDKSINLSRKIFAINKPIRNLPGTVVTKDVNYTVAEILELLSDKPTKQDFNITDPRYLEDPRVQEVIEANYKAAINVYDYYLKFSKYIDSQSFINGIGNVVLKTLENLVKNTPIVENGLNFLTSMFDDIPMANNTVNFDDPKIQRQIGVNIGKAINTSIGKNSTKRLHPNDIGLPDNGSYIILISSSFEATVTFLKDKIYSNIESYLVSELRKNKYTVKGGSVSLASLLNAGHSALSQVDDITFSKIAVNSPAMATILRNLGKGMPSAKDAARKVKVDQLRAAAQIFRRDSTLHENRIVIDKQFNSGKGTPLDLYLMIGGTITQAEDFNINQSRGREIENPLVKKLSDPKTLMNGSMSRTMLEFIRDSIAGKLVGIEISSEKAKKTATSRVVTSKVVLNTNKVSSILSGSKKATSKLNATITNPSVAFPNIKRPTKPNLPKVSGSTADLSKLLVILNSQLKQQIQRNMRKPALQNRTGRFAQSAKVERLSESRQGMITAFYSYMKSPYQTFEPGFKQGSEARNPKTLISKSIREIAASIVGNRLRAVRV